MGNGVSTGQGNLPSHDTRDVRKAADRKQHDWSELAVAPITKQPSSTCCRTGKRLIRCWRPRTLTNRQTCPCPYALYHGKHFQASVSKCFWIWVQPHSPNIYWISKQAQPILCLFLSFSVTGVVTTPILSRKLHVHLWSFEIWRLDHISIWASS